MITAAKIVFILSILGILFIIGRKLPALSRIAEEPFIERFSFRMIFVLPVTIIKRFISSNFFQNILIGDLEKSLRKLKIFALKIDNIIDKFIRKLKRNSRNGTPP